MGDINIDDKLQWIEKQEKKAGLVIKSGPFILLWRD